MSVVSNTVGALSRQDAMRQLLAGIADDLLAYPALQDLLQQQFQAALRHKASELGAVAEAISTLVDTMQARRELRVALVQRLVGPQGTMLQAFALLKNAARERMETDWSTLEQAVIACKALSKRNGDLLVEQYSIMQRVLHGEEQIYAPA
ncbi:flagella synthesis protein FlgN [Duganella sp. CF402]|uniref:flagellar export chaperone FlgN n=1 Tax=unclassified Duganella TaxID=2636909 RepID=UPI0008D50A96|nr:MULTISPECIES: flagellar export chaperone FlgN [unclassified Duganella]RZT09988.1 flagella synthesis protein FlgN [Duganella sp. BK701]SEL33883.1 flagella synthesis protein FlgN [Duganella sp. CF402]